MSSAAVMIGTLRVKVWCIVQIIYLVSASELLKLFLSLYCHPEVAMHAKIDLYFFQPLNPNPDSKWRAYFKDNEMLLQIDKDCR